MIKKAQEEAGITTESGEPLPKNVLDYVYIDPITPVPRVPLDDLERRVF